MTLIIEDGSIVANANSYVTDAEYVDYAATRGKTIATTATDREIELTLSMDYLYNQDYQGQRSEPDNQEQPFPRYGVYLNDRLLDSATIPKELKNAQMEGAIASNGQELLVNSSSGNVQSEKLDVLEISYFSNGKKTRIRLDRVNNYLSCLLNNSNRLVRS